jgi:site-specific recombinase XerD
MGEAWWQATEEQTEDEEDIVMAKKIRGLYEKVPGSGIWYIRYSEHGKIRREKVGNKSAALQLYQKRKTQIHQGEKLPENFRGKAVTFAELAQVALDYSKARKLSYRNDVCRMASLVREFGDRPADRMTPQDVERWLADQSDENNWQPATVNRYKALLSLVFRLGIENGKTKTNPARLVRRRRENNVRVRFLSHDEERVLRTVIERDYPGHLREFDIALHTGMRCSEQYDLKWPDVNFETRTITIRLSKHGETRHVRLNSVALGAFQELFRRSEGHGYVFVNARFERLLKPRHWFEPAVKTAGVEDFTWHCLRHTFASRLVMKGVDLRSVQVAMGHRTIQMTCRYAHLAPEHELAAVERLCEATSAAAVAIASGTDTRTSTSTNDRSPATISVFQ